MTYRYVRTLTVAAAGMLVILGLCTLPAFADTIPDLPVPTPSLSVPSTPTGTSSLPQGTGLNAPPAPDPGSVVLPSSGGGSDGGSDGGSTSGTDPTAGGGLTSRGGDTTAPGSGSQGVDPVRGVPAPAIKASLAHADESGRASFERFARRAGALAVPMAAPIGIAILGVIGLAVMARGASKLDSIEDEKESLGGWTSIKL